MNHQCINLALVVQENGLTWQLYPVDFKTIEGSFSFYLYALNREHAAAVLSELKASAVLRDGDLIAVTPGATS